MMTFVLVAHVRLITWNWSFSVDQKFFKVKITFNQLTKVSKFLDLQKKRTFHQLTKVLNSNLVSWLKVFKRSNLLIYWKENFWSTDQNEKSFILLKNSTKTIDKVKKAILDWLKFELVPSLLVNLKMLFYHTRKKAKKKNNNNSWKLVFAKKIIFNQ